MTTRTTPLPEIGSKFGYWEIIETGLINPNTKNKNFINKPVFSKCICTNCNKTILFKTNGDLNKAAKNNSMCNICSQQKRIAKMRTIKIGDVFHKLTVIGDGGVENRRHYSICQCECGNITRVRDNNLKTGQVRSCGCLKSIGETTISKILSTNDIIFEYDKIFPELLKETGRRLRFDFIIYNKDGSINRFVEFDGKQHFIGMDKGVWSHTETLDVIKERDQVKNNFCMKHNYKLIRIPYSALKTLCLEDIITDKYLYKEKEIRDGESTM